MRFYCLHQSSNSDINECSSGTDNCHYNAVCFDSDGSFTCICPEGYEGDGVAECESEKIVAVIFANFDQWVFSVVILSLDVNECERGIANCSENANCTDTQGNFTCTCFLGYTGDGFNCTSKNFFNECID